MSDNTSGRVQPGGGSGQPRKAEFLAVAPPATSTSVPTSSVERAATSPLGERQGLEQLSRIEEKSARIEEKFARSEALLLRVEATFEESVSHFHGVARQDDVAAIHSHVRGLPGFGALFFVGIVSAVLGAALALLALKYGIPGLLQPLSTLSPTAGTPPG